MDDELRKMLVQIMEGQEEIKLEVRKNTNVITTIENELKETKKTLYDGYVQNTEAINRVEAKVDELSEKVDRHDKKIQVIQGGKKAL